MPSALVMICRPPASCDRRCFPPIRSSGLHRRPGVEVVIPAARRAFGSTPHAPFPMDGASPVTRRPRRGKRAWCAPTRGDENHAPAACARAGPESGLRPCHPRAEDDTIDNDNDTARCDAGRSAREEGPMKNSGHTSTVRPEHIFRDRREAGRVLGELLEAYRGDPRVVVLGLARGGVPVAWEVAAAWVHPSMPSSYASSGSRPRGVRDGGTGRRQSTGSKLPLPFRSASSAGLAGRRSRYWWVVRTDTPECEHDSLIRAVRTRL